MGTIQAPPGVNIPAVLLPLLQAMVQTDRSTQPSLALALTSLLMEKLILVLGWFRVQVLAAANDALRRVKWVGPMT